MVLMTLKEYAEKNNVTYEAIRQQIKRYSEELKNHITKDGRQQFLDEEAVAFLDEKRKKNPVVIYQADKDEEIEILKREKENLLIRVAEQAREIAEFAKWKSENSMLITENQRQQILLEEKNKTIQNLETRWLHERECVEEANKKTQEASDQIKKLEDQLHLEQQEKKQMADQLDVEKKRKLTLRERLFGRKETNDF